MAGLGTVTWSLLPNPGFSPSKGPTTSVIPNFKTYLKSDTNVNVWGTFQVSPDTFLVLNLQIVGWLSCQIPATQWQAVGCLFYHRLMPHLLSSYVSLTSFRAEWEREALTWLCSFHMSFSPAYPCLNQAASRIGDVSPRGKKASFSLHSNIAREPRCFQLLLIILFIRYQSNSHSLQVTKGMWQLPFCLGFTEGGEYSLCLLLTVREWQAEKSQTFRPLCVHAGASSLWGVNTFSLLFTTGRKIRGEPITKCPSKKTFCEPVHSRDKN